MRIQKGGVAFFDSGIGGLTVLSSCQNFLQDKIVYYYGDNAHAPYGNLPPKKIKRYVYRAFRLFSKLQVQAAVIACNTVTALCIEELRKKYTFPIIGAEPAVLSVPSVDGEVFVLSTRATYESTRFKNLCRRVKQKHNTLLRAFACDRLAGEIELHLTDQTYSYDHLFPQGNPKAVVLGCTHYIYIKEKISSYYHCEVYDGNEGISKRLRSVLHSNEKKTSVLKEQSRYFWDGRPLCLFFDKTNGNKITQNSRKQKGNTANKCSWLQKMPSGQKWGKIFFLGSGKRRNFEVFKQTFEFKS